MHALEIGMLHLIEWIILQLQQFPYCLEFVVCISKGGCIYVSNMLRVCCACVSCPLSSNVLNFKGCSGQWVCLTLSISLFPGSRVLRHYWRRFPSCSSIQWPQFLWTMDLVLCSFHFDPLLVTIHLPLSFLVAHTCCKPPWPTHRRSEIANFMGRVVKSSQATLHLIYFTVHTWNLEDICFLLICYPYILLHF